MSADLEHKEKMASEQQKSEAASAKKYVKLNKLTQMIVNIPSWRKAESNI